MIRTYEQLKHQSDRLVKYQEHLDFLQKIGIKDNEIADKTISNLKELIEDTEFEIFKITDDIKKRHGVL